MSVSITIGTCMVCGVSQPKEKMTICSAGVGLAASPEPGEFFRWVCWKHVKEIERLKKEQEYYEGLMDLMEAQNAR